MKFLKHYDKDLRPLVLAARLLVAANIAGIVYAAWRRAWMLAIAYAIWACNMGFQWLVIKQRQHYRDESRIMLAAARGERR